MWLTFRKISRLRINKELRRSAAKMDDGRPVDLTCNGETEERKEVEELVT